MAESPDLGEIVRRAVQANARFYQGWVELSLEYLRGISEIFGETGNQPPAPAGEADDDGAGVLVLEGEAGTDARGAFLVTNDLGRNLACELVPGEFTTASGERALAKPSFEPPRIELAPGEQRVVQVTLPIDPALTPGVAYSGQFSVKGMEGFSVPVVLRRRHRIDESPIDRELATEPGREDAPGPGKSRRAKAAGKSSPARKPAGGRRR